MLGPRWCLIAVLLLGGVAGMGCGDDDTQVGDVGAQGDDVCDAFEDLAAADDAFQGELNELLAPVLAAAESGDQQAAEEAADAMAAGMGDPLADGAPGLLAAYDRLEGLVPEALADEVVLVRNFTSDLIDQLAAAEPTLDAFLALLDNAAGASGIEAGQAVLAIDEFSRETCDVVIAD